MSPVPSKAVPVAAQSRRAVGSAVRAYLELTKPGIALMEVVTAIVGYVVAEPWRTHSLPAVLGGAGALSVAVLLLSSSAGVFNHILERDSDAVMRRTSLRPLPAGKVALPHAVWFGSLLGAVGVAVAMLLGWHVALLGAMTIALYVLVYTPLKSRTPWALYVGGIPGALPVVGGWIAGGGSLLSVEAAILFAIMFWWQVPHFLALALLYADDYRRGGVALFGDGRPKALAVHTLASVVLLVLSAVAWHLWGRGGVLYALGCAALSAWLLYLSLRLVQCHSSADARRVLLATYMYLMGLFILMAVDVR